MNNGFYSGGLLNQNDTPATATYSWQINVPNFTTNAVTTFSLYYVNPNGKSTNQTFSQYYNTNSGSGISSDGSQNVIIQGTGKTLFDYVQTNNWPDTNCQKTIGFIGQGANTFVYMTKVMVTAKGPNRGTNY